MLNHARKMLCIFDAEVVTSSEEIASTCDGMADAMQKYDSNERREKYRKMLDKAALNNGARDAYAILKIRPDRKIANSEDNEGVDDQAHAEAQVDKWAAIWAATYTGPLPTMRYHLQPTSTQDTSSAVISGFMHTSSSIKQATKKHKMNTALGIDSLSPKPGGVLICRCMVFFCR